MKRQYIARLALGIRHLRESKNKNTGWIYGFLAAGVFGGFLTDLQYEKIGNLISQIEFS